MTPNTTVTGRCRTFAMDNHFPAAVNLLPGEIVMILHASNNLGAEQFGDEPMDDVVIGCCVIAHQIHGGPILLPGLASEIQPG